MAIPFANAGFVFENTERNKFLTEQFQKSEHNGVINGFQTTKTGTTIVGILVQGAVILAADTRSTAGPIVADKNCEKLHPLAETIFAAGAGTAADLFHQTAELKSNLELHRLATGRRPRTATVVSRMSQHLFRYQGHCGVALVVGGFDETGPSLYSIAPHGSTDRLAFTAMGSGSLHAMSILERGYTEDISVEEGVALVTEAIKAGIMNDLASGSNVDIVIVRDTGCEVMRNHYTVPRTYRMPENIKFKAGVTEVISESFTPFE